MWPMLPAGNALILIDSRCSAKLARHNNQSAVEHASIAQVDKQCGKRVIEHWQAPAHAV